MRTWVALWIFPLGVVISLALLVQSTWIAQVLAVIWAFVAVPGVAVGLLRRAPGGPDQVNALETDYWRTDLSDRRR